MRGDPPDPKKFRRGSSSSSNFGLTIEDYLDASGLRKQRR